jgi:hypothetical protein
VDKVKNGFNCRVLKKVIVFPHSAILFVFEAFMNATHSGTLDESFLKNLEIGDFEFHDTIESIIDGITTNDLDCPLFLILDEFNVQNL